MKRSTLSFAPAAFSRHVTGQIHFLQSTIKSTLQSTLLATMLAAPVAQAEISGVVIDASSKAPIASAYVTLNGQSIQTDANGAFHFETAVEKKSGTEKSSTEKPATENALATADKFASEIRVRSVGYQRKLIPLGDAANPLPAKIELTPFEPRALYLSVYGIGSGVLRPAALKLIDNKGLNALVIDIKGDAGLVGYKSNVATAAEIGARKVTTVRDMKAMVDSLHQQGIYTIARIVAFKDNPLARSKPELAIRTRNGEIFQDREGLAWADPFQPAVWEYNLQLAEEAAQMGFDEVQFDYIRFPDTRGLQFSKENTETNRVAAITGMLTAARKRLEPYNVFLGADIFGYACWNTNDTEIGQRIEDLAKPLDIISPMLYPSGFQFGIPGFLNPVANSYEIVFRSLQRARQRTGLSPQHFRPWLQAFRDYAFDRRVFGPDEIQQQIRAAQKFGSGYMMWNPRNVYSAEAFYPTTRMSMKEQEPKGEAHQDEAKPAPGG